MAENGTFTSAPTRQGTSNGEKVTHKNGRGTAERTYIWNADEKKWKIWAPDSPEEQNRRDREDQLNTQLGSNGTFNGASLSDIKTLRYPRTAKGGGSIAASSDFILFEFLKYSPPFSKVVGSRPDQQPDQRTNTGASAGNYFNYNQNNYEPADAPAIIMYMPEDISSGFRSNWGGKSFSNIASGILRAAGAEGLSKLDNLATEIGNTAERMLKLTGAAALRKSIQSITGDSISNDDIFGSISGAILNPNAELLFQSVDMRNFQLTYKLVPRNDDETKDINDIIKVFKYCTLPSRDPGNVFGGTSQGTAAGFIGVPNLCRVSFMKGSNLHPYLPIYKVCAITQVDVNYTPDGAYATYTDGQPVAVQLTLNFQETKLVFAEEIANDSIR